MEQLTKCAEIFYTNGKLKYVCLLCSNYKENCQQFEQHFYTTHLNDLIYSTNISNDDFFCVPETIEKNPINILSRVENLHFEIVEIKEEFDVDPAELIETIENHNKEILIDENSKDNLGNTTISIHEEAHHEIVKDIVKDQQQINNKTIKTLDETVFTKSNLKCKHCNLQFEYRIQRDRHNCRFKKLRYKCTECGEQMCGIRLFNTHMDQFHMKKPSELSNCISMRIENNLEILIDENSKIISLTEQKNENINVIDNEKQQQIHNNSNNINKNNFLHKQMIAKSNLRCWYCNLQFECADQLRKHSWRFKVLKYKCKECGVQICGTNLFKAHKNRFHFVKPTPRRRTESKKKVIEKEKKSKIKKIETKEKKVKEHRPKYKRQPSTIMHTCDICKHEVREIWNLKTHMRLHTGEKPHVCDHCDKRFSIKSSLEMHIRHHHTKERPYLCTECGACFAFLRTLNAHVRLCHEKDKDTLTPCPICAKIFRGTRNLRKHIRTHSTIRPFSCNQCNKTFKSNRVLIQHSKIHLETKSYPCPFCELSFAQSAGRRGHIRRIHEGK